MLIFDIGANRGAWTKANLNSGKNFILVEANPFLASSLKNEVFNLNKNIIVLNYAVSFNLNPITFYISDADTISTCSEEWINNSRFSGQYSWSPITVRSVTLDKLIDDYGTPDLIKIDTEGFEYEVICGLTKKVPMLCFEWAEESLDKILLTVKRLQSIGFTEFSICDGDDYSYRPTIWSQWENINFDAKPERKSKWGMIWSR